MATTPALRSSLPRPSERLLAEQGLALSPLCLGLGRSEDLACEAFDAGVNFFFLSADLHWPLYEAARRGLERLLARGGDIRDRIVVAGVSYVAQPGFAEAALNELVAAVPGLRRLDLLVAGGCYAQDLDGRVPLFRSLRDQGHCGAIGCGATFHHRQSALSALRRAELDLAWVRYNPRHPGAEEDLFPHLGPDRRALLYTFGSTFGYVSPQRCQALGLEGYWQPEITDHYRFALSRPDVDGLLCALSSPAELRMLLDALDRGALVQEEVDHMIALAGADLEARGRDSGACVPSEFAV